MKRRVFIYWLTRCHPAAIILSLNDYFTFRLLPKLIPSRFCHGIELIAFPGRLPELEKIASALELVKRKDDKRFRKIERSITRVVLKSSKPKGFGSYEPLGQICTVYELQEEANHQLSIIAYAGILVQQATHALLHRRRFPYSKSNASRMERICNLEMGRFMGKFPAMHSGNNLAAAFGFAKIRVPERKQSARK